MKPNGHVDGLMGCYLLGWAVPGNPANSRVVYVKNARGELVATGEASLRRDDLTKLGRGNSAFRIGLGEIRDTDVLHISMDGAELAGSPISVGPGRYDGYVSVTNGVVQGWVTERIATFNAPVINIIDQDGDLICQAQSQIDRRRRDKLFTPALFSAPIADRCFGRHELHLRALVNGVNFARVSCSLTLRGHLDHVSRQRCAGWLLSPDAPQRSFEIEIYRNGMLTATVKADMAHQDLRTDFPTAWRAGFDISFPESDGSPTALTSLSFRLRGCDSDLFDGPYLLGDFPATILAVRKAASLAHDIQAKLTVAERSLVQTALAEFITKVRDRRQATLVRKIEPDHSSAPGPRLNIIIPIYRDVEATRTCIDSVLAHRSATMDNVILVNDCSPEPEMAEMLRNFVGTPKLFLLNNETNLGFVKSVNRALNFCRRGAVVVLNSDTRVFSGGFDELWRVATSSREIGTVTAMSNNATIFSYPHASLRRSELKDISWERLAAIALAENNGRAIDVPTAHGFCMLIKREVLQRIGLLDESFGRGYGEENDFCSRAADLGFRNVAAVGAFVEHRESLSFVEEKEELLKQNLARIDRMYPEYMPFISEFERRDELRMARWALDAARLKFASEAGRSFVLVVEHWLGGGTKKAASDIEGAAEIAASDKITLFCREDGFLEVVAEDPLLRTVFAIDEVEPLFNLLSTAQLRLIIVHHLVGFPAAVIRRLATWVQAYKSIYYVHDFYAACPRINLIDAAEQFCDVAPLDVCERCVAVGGTHGASRLRSLSPGDHRALFAELLQGFRYIVAPSESAAACMLRAFPEITIETIPHPESGSKFPTAPRPGIDDEVIILGAIGPHKGSAKLLEIAQRARLLYPKLRFRVIGYTNIDSDLIAVGNVIVTGRYEQAQLPTLIAQSKGRLALFLQNWPETYSYSLSEAVAFGLVPLVPDIGALAERVRRTGFGMVFPFPIDAGQVLRLIEGISCGRQQPWEEGASPENYCASPETITRVRSLFAELADTTSQPALSKSLKRFTLMRFAGYK